MEEHCTFQMIKYDVVIVDKHTFYLLDIFKTQLQTQSVTNNNHLWQKKT